VSRPCKLTHARKKKVVQLVRAGNFLSVAAGAAGISESTFHEWMRRGRAEVERRQTSDVEVDPEEAKFAEFYEDVIRAELDAEAVLVALVRTAASSNWQAALRLLERRHPDRWSERRHVGVNAKIDGGVVLEPGPTARAILGNPKALELSLAAIDALAEEEDGTPPA
jgi:hypothetical protein